MYEQIAQPDIQFLTSRAIIGATALLGAVVSVDLLSQAALWRKNYTGIIAAEETTDTQRAPRWLAIPGLGQQNGQFIAESMHGLLDAPVDYAHLSERGISSKSIGRALAHYYDTFYAADDSAQPEQRLLLHSMGLPTYLMGVEWCVKQKVAVPPVHTLVAFSSPLNAKHTYMERRIKTLAKYPYPGGALSKMGIEFFRRYEVEKFKIAALGKTMLSAARCSFRECSPALWSSQIRTIADRDSYHDGIFKGVITPNTQLIHFGDEADETVNVQAARLGMLDFARSYGAQLTIVDTPGDGHANVRGQRTKSSLLALLTKAA